MDMVEDCTVVDTRNGQLGTVTIVSGDECCVTWSNGMTGSFKMKNIPLNGIIVLPALCIGEFGLRGHAGVFKINARTSYNDQIVVSIVSLAGTMDFSRCSVSELISQIRPLVRS